MKRIKYLFVSALICLLALFFRVYYLAVLQNDTLFTMAESQRNMQIKLNGGRGNIYDRNLLSFTSVGKKKVLALIKSKDFKEDYRVLNTLEPENANRLFNSLQKNGSVYLDIPWDYDTEEIRSSKNLCVFEDTKRYKDDGVGAAIIGYLQDGRGVTGLEFACETYLKNGDGYSIDVFKDAKGTFLPGFSFDKKQNDGTYLKTTLDKKYMEICQEALKDVTGAAVLLDTKTFDVVAMVSSPTFNPNAAYSYFDNAHSVLLNRATAMYDMGSIFKIVVMATALEKGKVEKDDFFTCNQGKTVGNVRFICKNHGQMEKLTAEEAFLHSCNAVFIDIGQKTEYNNIIDMAMSFGLGQDLINPLSFPQNKGVLPDKDNYYLADLANLSIGQGKLLGTTVHGAVLSAVVANKGIRKSVNILDCLLNPDFTLNKSLRENKQLRVISEETASVLKEMMIKTVQYGTGKNASVQGILCGGKTGSAQTGMLYDSQEGVHGWFTGFFPAEKPAYALCVFVENGRSGAQSAAPIFKKIQEKIAKAEGWI